MGGGTSHSGRAVSLEEEAKATSALRLPGRMESWRSDALGRERAWMLRLFEANPLRRQRQVWRQRCGGAPGFEFVSYVLEHGLTVVDPKGRPEPFQIRNHGSCVDASRAKMASEILNHELEQGFLAVAPTTLRARCKWIHPLGLIPKGEDKVRIIHDFSAPAGGSLNDKIDYVRLGYDKVDAAFAALRRGCYMAKIDISAFFRHIPLDPADWELMAFRWDGEVLVDTRLNFGQRNAPEVAYRFSMVVLWHVRGAMGTLGLVSWVKVFVVCDDWLVVADREVDCERVWKFILEALEELGFTVNRLPHKCIAPRHDLPWLGLQFDALELTVALPADKLVKAQDVIRQAMGATKVTRRVLDSLFGYLSFCSTVVYGGRAFLHGVRRLRYRADGVARAGHHKIYVNRALKEDMRWWLAHLEGMNGDRRVPMVAAGVEHEQVEAYLDARGGSGGIGVFVDGAFIGLTGEECNAKYPWQEGEAYGVCSPGVRRQVAGGCWEDPSVHANHWELFAFCVLLDTFPDVVRNRFLVVRSDSMSACKCIRDLSASLDSLAMAHLVRVFLSLAVKLNCRVCPEHIAGKKNVLADALSRAQWHEFGRQAHEWNCLRGGRSSPFLAML